MDTDIKYQRKVLKHLLSTKNHPDRVRRLNTVISSLGFPLLFFLILGPIIYFRDLGAEKYVLIVCGIAAGMVAMYSQYNSVANRTLETLHPFIDFDKVASSIKQDAT